MRRGIGSVPEARRLFGDMSVRENLLMGAFVRTAKREIEQDLDRMLSLFPNWANAWRRGPARCRAASSRWSPWPAP